MSVEIDFKYIQEIGNEVKDILYNDPEKSEWINEVIDEYNEYNDFRENLISEIIDYLIALNDDKLKELANEVIRIENEDGADNILTAIFLGGEEEEEEIACISTADKLIIIDGDDEEELDESNPKQYFEKQIHQIEGTYNISYDLAYLLLKKYEFNLGALQNEWFSSQENVLKSLHITIGSANVPSLKSPISFKNLGVGECPICYEDDNEIYELYCGHKFCKKCLFIQMKNQVSVHNPPVCPNNCGAEILSHDVLLILEGHPDLIKKYEISVINAEINLDHEVRRCICCDSIITPAHKISLLFGRCANCKYATCLKCDKGFHGPLTCSRFSDFFGDRKNNMQQLEEDQESWYFRERRLQSYRREHKQPVFKFFEQRLKEVQEKNRKEVLEEKQKLGENKEFISLKTNELTHLKNQEKTYRDKKDNSNLEKVQKEIANVKAEIEKRKYLDETLKATFEKNEKDRKKDLEDVDTEKELLINAISNETKFDFFLDEYKMLLNSEAYQSLNVTLTDEETIKRSTKLCPKCKAPIEKSQGCNYMKCICGFEFCYFCNLPWNPTHSDHHKCPKYDLMSQKRKGKSQCGIDFDNMNDMNFYPPPMTAEKRKDYIKYSNLSMQYMNSKEKLDKFEEDFRKTNDESGEQLFNLDDDKLAPKNKLIKCLMQQNAEKTSRLYADQIINTIVFGQKIVMYGFPQMYYIMLQQKDAMVFEYHLYRLEACIDELIELIMNYNNKNSNHSINFDKYTNMIESEAHIILDEGEKL